MASLVSRTGWKDVHVAYLSHKACWTSCHCSSPRVSYALESMSNHILTDLRSAFFMGFPFLITIFNLPQKFQIVNGLSPVEAGIRMLPLLLLTALASGVTGAICSKKNIAFQFLILSNALQIVAAGLLSMLPTDGSIPSYQYGLQVILGYAFGMGLVSLMIVTRVEVSTDDSGTQPPLAASTYN